MAQQGPSGGPRNESVITYGSNTAATQEIFEQRMIYNNVVLPDQVYPRLFKTWGKDQYYGLLDTYGNAVRVQKGELHPLSFCRGNTTHALNFVADAWRDFALRLRQLSNEQIIFQNSPWSAPTISKAWLSSNEEYYQYLSSNVYSAFNGIYLGTSEREANISDFSSFLALFEQFIDDVLAGTGPLTLSGLIESNYLSPLISGLMLEIDTGKYDDDYYKSLIYKDNNFQMVQGLAQQYGFAIDKNIPWRLVADLRNPAMREYMYGVPIVDFSPEGAPPDNCDPFYENPDSIPRAYGYSQLPGLESVVRRVSVYVEGGQIKPGYRQYQELKEMTNQEDIYKVLYKQAFEETWTLDMDLFSYYILNFYNTYAESRPITTVRDPFPIGAQCPPEPRVVRRSPISEEEFASQYDDLWRLKTFYVARSMERDIQRDQNHKVRDLQQALNIYQLSRNDAYDRALRYMQEKYIGPLYGQRLTANKIGDIMRRGTGTTGSKSDDLSNAGRQNRVRGNLY